MEFFLVSSNSLRDIKPSRANNDSSCSIIRVLDYITNEWLVGLGALCSLPCTHIAKLSS